jgi:tetratricopeptide (TPR) repeat protein
VAIVDLTRGLRQGSPVSGLFRFKETYREKCSYWELKDPRNPLGLHPLVQPLDAGGTLADLLLARGSKSLQKGESKPAEAMISEALRRNPKNAMAYVAQGMLHADAGDYDRAFADLSAALRHDPSCGRACLLRGGMNLAKGRIDRSLGDLDEAVRLNPKFAAAYATRGEAHFHQAARDEAFAASMDDSAINSPNTETKGDAGSSKDGKTDQAAAGDPDPGSIKVGGFLQANKEPSYSSGNSSQEQLAHKEEYKGKVKRELELALADCNAAIRLDPKVSWYYRARGAVYAARGEVQKELADLSEAVRLDPKDVENLTLRSQVYVKQGDLEKAIADTTEIIRLNPKSPEAYEHRADLYSRKHDTNKAAADYAQAMRLRPGEDRYR